MCLTAEVEEAAHVSLCPWRPDQFLEEVTLFDEALRERPLCGVDRFLCEFERVFRKRSNSRGQRIDEGYDLARTESAVEEPPLLRRNGIEVIAAEDDLECSTSADQARQSLRPAASGQDAQGHFHLIQDRLAAHTETHVHGLRKLTA